MNFGMRIEMTKPCLIYKMLLKNMPILLQTTVERQKKFLQTVNRIEIWLRGVYYERV